MIIIDAKVMSLQLPKEKEIFEIEINQLEVRPLEVRKRLVKEKEE